MNQLDLILLSVFVLFTVYGAIKGLINQLFRLAAILAAYLGARYFGAKIQSILTSHFDSYLYLDILVYPLLFVSIVLIVRLLGKGATAATSYVALGGINRFLGGLLGSVSALIVVLATYQAYTFLVIHFEYLEISSFSNSTFAPYLEKLILLIRSFIA